MNRNRQWSWFGIGCGLAWIITWMVGPSGFQDPKQTDQSLRGSGESGSVAALQIATGDLPAIGVEQKPEPQAADWMQRVEMLERRMYEMEQILLTTSQITALEAERRLRDAKARLADSRELFLRGQVAEIEFQNDRFEVDRLTRELELTRGTNARHQAMSQIEIANAEQQLFAAQQDLEQTETLVRRGYASATQIDRDREYVDLATRRLELSKQRLDAAKKLDELNQKKAGSDTEQLKK